MSNDLKVNEVKIGRTHPVWLAQKMVSLGGVEDELHREGKLNCVSASCPDDTYCQPRSGEMDRRSKCGVPGRASWRRTVAHPSQANIPLGSAQW